MPIARGDRDDGPDWRSVCTVKGKGGRDIRQTPTKYRFKGKGRGTSTYSRGSRSPQLEVMVASKAFEVYLCKSNRLYDEKYKENVEGGKEGGKEVGREGRSEEGKRDGGSEGKKEGRRE